MLFCMHLVFQYFSLFIYIYMCLIWFSHILHMVQCIVRRGCHRRLRRRRPRAAALPHGRRLPERRASHGTAHRSREPPQGKHSSLLEKSTVLVHFKSAALNGSFRTNQRGSGPHGPWPEAPAPRPPGPRPPTATPACACVRLPGANSEIAIFSIPSTMSVHN